MSRSQFRRNKKCIHTFRFQVYWWIAIKDRPTMLSIWQSPGHHHCLCSRAFFTIVAGSFRLTRDDNAVDARHLQQSEPERKSLWFASDRNLHVYCLLLSMPEQEGAAAEGWSGEKGGPRGEKEASVLGFSSTKRPHGNGTTVGENRGERVGESRTAGRSLLLLLKTRHVLRGRKRGK